MAWLDDRAWCHPKLVDLSDKAFRAYVNSISYSSGMGLRGRLSPAHQRLLGADTKIAQQIVDAGLWHFEDNGYVAINDWDEHNGKRDERRRADRERKRQARKQSGMSAGTSAGLSTGTARVEGSEGSEGSDGQVQKHADFKNPDAKARLFDVLSDANFVTRAKVAELEAEYGLFEGDYEEARQAAMSDSARSPSAVALSVLEKRVQSRVHHVPTEAA